MEDKIRLIEPSIEFQEIEKELKEVFKTGIFTKGINVKIFENHLRNYTGSRYAFLTTSATTALALSLKALNIKQGDRVAVADFSWPATCNVVEDLGAIPVFIDVDKKTYNICPLDLSKKLNNGISAVISVDAFGNPSGILEIKKICKKYKIPLIQDAACSIGSSISKLKVGNIADITCFSFHPRKLVTTGEGGALLTNNKRLSEWIQIKLNAGAKQNNSRISEFIDFGYNLRMSEIQALMGWKQLEKIDKLTEERNRIAQVFIQGLSSLGFVPQALDEEVHHNIQSLCFSVPNGINRNDLISYLDTKNIEATIGTYCLSAQPFYRNKYKSKQKNSYWLQNNCITLPCYPNVDTSRIIETINDFFNKTSLRDLFSK